MNGKVYFFGGTFDPMTKAHLGIIRKLVERLEEGDLVVAGITDHLYKSHSPELSWATRKEILEKELEREFGKDWGRKIRLVRQTKRTWDFFHSEEMEIYPVSHLVIGRDEAESLRRGEWVRSQDLLDHYAIVEEDRGESSISSTRVREGLKELLSMTSPFALKKMIEEKYE